jgi:hypothetical protein
MGYDMEAAEYPQIFNVETSSKKFEQDVGMAGLQMFSVKPEGESVTYDEANQTFVQQFNHYVYASGLIITEEAYDDNQYNIDVFKPRSMELAFAAKTTRETIAANVLNRGFNTAYTMGAGSSGKPLFSATQIAGGAGVTTAMSNLSTAGDMSELVLEGMVINIVQAVDNRGKHIKLMPHQLVIPPGVMMDAERILGSPLQNDTANNAINVLKSKSWFPGGIVVNHYLTDTDAFFITTSINKSGGGLIWYDRKPLTFGADNEFDTSNAKYKASFRASAGWRDFRGVYGNAGI